MRAIQGSIKCMHTECVRRSAEARDFSSLETPAASQIICPVFQDYSQSIAIKQLLAQLWIDLQ